MNISEITETIKKGLAKGYRQNLLLLSSYSDFSDDVREYLLTINVAQQLLEWNHNHFYKVEIEYPILNFYNNTFPSHSWEMTDIFNMALVYRKSGHASTDRLNQKIDLAITEEQTDLHGSSHERSLVGIELKGINKNENDIIRDAERLAKAMLLKDEIEMGENSIKFCFCGFLKRFDENDELITEVDILERTEAEKKHWISICHDLSTKFIDLKFSIDFFDIARTSLEDISAIHEKMESDYSEVANATGIIVGGILIIERNEIK